MHASDLAEQNFGLLLSLCAVALFIVWAIDTAPLIRYGVTSVIVMMIVLRAASSILKKVRIQKIRASHIKEGIRKDV